MPLNDNKSKDSKIAEQVKNLNRQGRKGRKGRPGGKPPAKDQNVTVKMSKADKESLRLYFSKNHDLSLSGGVRSVIFEYMVNKGLR